MREQRTVFERVEDEAQDEGLLLDGVAALVAKQGQEVLRVVEEVVVPGVLLDAELLLHAVADEGRADLGGRG